MQPELWAGTGTANPISDSNTPRARVAGTRFIDSLYCTRARALFSPFLDSEAAPNCGISGVRRMLVIPEKKCGGTLSAASHVVNTAMTRVSVAHDMSG